MNATDEFEARATRRRAMRQADAAPREECIRLDWDGVAGQRCVRVTTVRVGTEDEPDHDERRERLIGTVTEPMS